MEKWLYSCLFVYAKHVNNLTFLSFSSGAVIDVEVIWKYWFSKVQSIPENAFSHMGHCRSRYGKKNRPAYLMFAAAPTFNRTFGHLTRFPFRVHRSYRLRIIYDPEKSNLHLPLLFESKMGFACDVTKTKMHLSLDHFFLFFGTSALKKVWLKRSSFCKMKCRVQQRFVVGSFFFSQESLHFQINLVVKKLILLSCAYKKEVFFWLFYWPLNRGLVWFKNLVHSQCQ